MLCSRGRPAPGRSPIARARRGAGHLPTGSKYFSPIRSSALSHLNDQLLHWGVAVVVLPRQSRTKKETITNTHTILAAGKINGQGTRNARGGSEARWAAVTIGSERSGPRGGTTRAPRSGPNRGTCRRGTPSQQPTIPITPQPRATDHQVTHQRNALRGRARQVDGSANAHKDETEREGVRRVAYQVTTNTPTAIPTTIGSGTPSAVFW